MNEDNQLGRPTIGHNSGERFFNDLTEEEKAAWRRAKLDEIKASSRRWKDPTHVAFISQLRAAIKDGAPQVVNPDDVGSLGAAQPHERRRIIGAARVYAIFRLMENPRFASKGYAGLVEYIAERSDNSYGRCVDSAGSMAVYVDLSERTVQDMLKALRMEGIIGHDSRPGNPTAYWPTYLRSFMTWENGRSVSGQSLIDAISAPGRGRRGRPPKGGASTRECAPKPETENSNVAGTGGISINPHVTVAKGISDNPNMAATGRFPTGENPPVPSQNTPRDRHGTAEALSEDYDGQKEGETVMRYGALLKGEPLMAHELLAEADAGNDNGRQVDPPPIALAPSRQHAEESKYNSDATLGEATLVHEPSHLIVPSDDQRDLYWKVAAMVRHAQLGAGTEEARDITDLQLRAVVGSYRTYAPEVLSCALDAALLTALDIATATKDGRSTLWNGKPLGPISALPTWLRAHLGTKIGQAISDRVKLEAEIAVLRRNADTLAQAKVDANLRVISATADADVEHAVARKKIAEAKAQRAVGPSRREREKLEVGGDGRERWARDAVAVKLGFIVVEGRHANAVLDAHPEASVDDVRNVFEVLHAEGRTRETVLIGNFTKQVDLPVLKLVDVAKARVRKHVAHHLHGTPEQRSKGTVAKRATGSAVATDWFAASEAFIDLVCVELPGLAETDPKGSRPGRRYKTDHLGGLCGRTDEPRDALVGRERVIAVIDGVIADMAEAGEVAEPHISIRYGEPDYWSSTEHEIIRALAEQNEQGMKRKAEREEAESKATAEQGRKQLRAEGEAEFRKRFGEPADRDAFGRLMFVSPDSGHFHFPEDKTRYGDEPNLMIAAQQNFKQCGFYPMGAALAWDRLSDDQVHDLIEQARARGKNAPVMPANPFSGATGFSSKF